MLFSAFSDSGVRAVALMFPSQKQEKRVQLVTQNVQNEYHSFPLLSILAGRSLDRMQTALGTPPGKHIDLSLL